VLGVGCASVDDLIYIDAYPGANAKARVRESVRHFGGLTSTALVAAARLGSRCAFAGVLGEDDLSEAVVEQLRREGVGVSAVRRRPDARPVHSVIVVGEAGETRNIFFSLEGVIAAEPGWPDAELIRSAKVLFVDYVGVEGSISAATLAREAGIPVVADIEDEPSPAIEKLVSLVDHLVLSDEFAARLTGLSDPAAMVDRLWSDDRETVVVTVGVRGSWRRSTGDLAPRHQSAYRVEVVDTTGCGDVFHGAYASALARGLDPAARVSFASAAAALKATKRGAQPGIPTRAAVEAFQEAYVS
jgi:sugar/nucleoside kinase (ribokinase family)